MPPSSPDNFPLTAAEASHGERTSAYQEVLSFLEGLKSLPGSHVLSITEFGITTEGRSMPFVVAANPPLAGAQAVMESGKIRILVNANIHAGEVEGKEAVLMILREIAQGDHSELLKDAVILFVPIYNADGNERFDRSNRVTQNGPNEGVGIRPNAMGLDLNRDFIKVEAPETKAMLGLMRDFDPHVFMDLHTTNGSYHGYHLTYSPSLSTHVDAELDLFNRNTLLPEVRANMQENHGLRVFDYGNFTEDASPEWVTYDHRPRFGTNYVGLRNRISVLSEAYSYFDFSTRIHVTRNFVIEVLQSCVRHQDEIRQVTGAADERALVGNWTLGYKTHLGGAEREGVLVGGVEDVILPNNLGTRHVVLPEYEEIEMIVRRRFQSDLQQDYPLAWVLPHATESMHELLQLHGVEFSQTTVEKKMLIEVFAVDHIQRNKELFQGHYEIQIFGSWKEETRAIPNGSLLIPAHQKLARVAAQLLEPLSEDSASTWGRLSGWEKQDGLGQSDSPVWRLPKVD